MPIQAIDDTYLIARWTFDDGTATDSSGNNHHGSIHRAQPISGLRETHYGSTVLTTI
ncbi:MAG: hypothetical protein QCH96_04845 [Candidatus Thermoplasmatota archaeon]|nr:hypothetical protein [Candidatus Thermoplasmatota archaeon]